MAVLLSELYRQLNAPVPPLPQAGPEEEASRAEAVGPRRHCWLTADRCWLTAHLPIDARVRASACVRSPFHPSYSSPLIDAPQQNSRPIRNQPDGRMCSLGHYIPAFVEAGAHYGFDCIWLDLEHRNFTDREVQALLAYSHLHNIDIMVRTPTREKTKLYRYLEDGGLRG